MSFGSEFREFALKGNVMDLAVGVIIGGAFGKIVDSVVSDLIMPIVSRIFGGLDFSSYYIGLAGQAGGMPLAEAKKAGAVLAYGNFITIALNFVILAFIIFLMVKQMHRPQFRHPGLHHLPDGQADEPPQARGPGRTTGPAAAHARGRAAAARDSGRAQEVSNVRPAEAVAGPGAWWHVAY